MIEIINRLNKVIQAEFCKNINLNPKDSFMIIIKILKRKLYYLLQYDYILCNFKINFKIKGTYFFEKQYLYKITV